MEYPAEVTKRLIAEATAKNRHLRKLEKKTPGWIKRIADRDPEVAKVRGARDLIESMVEQARVALKLPDEFAPGFVKKERGRPCVAEHPLPRRDAEGYDPLHYEKDHKNHRYYFQLACPKCYSREYLYFQNHPEKRPKGIRTAGTDDSGRVIAERIYQHGWDPEKHPFKA